LSSISSQQDKWLTCAELSVHLSIGRTMAHRVAGSCYAGRLYKGRLLTVKKSSSGSYLTLLSSLSSSSLLSVHSDSDFLSQVDYPFCDRIYIYQNHDSSCRKVHDGWGDFFLVNGESDFTSYKAFRFQGSYSTSIGIRSDGHRVQLVGNVGRFDREDNIFNYGITDTVVIANKILISQGLPPFTIGQCFDKLRTKVFSAIDVKENPKLINSFIRRLSANPNVSSISQVKEKFSGVRVRWLERVWTGARFLGIHLTANYEFGSDELMNQ
jgi:hypothetical protein